MRDEAVSLAAFGLVTELLQHLMASGSLTTDAAFDIVSRAAEAQERVAAAAASITNAEAAALIRAAWESIERSR